MQLEQSHIDFKVFTPSQVRFGRRWLQLAVLSLGLAGVFALLLVLSRAPGSEDFFPWIDFFHTALVVHVDQSVLVWLLSMSGMLVALLASPREGPAIWRQLAFTLALTGTLGIALAAFVGAGAPLMNNYVPVLRRPFFFVMLGLFALGIGLQVLFISTGGRPLRLPLSRGFHLPTLGGWSIALALLISLLALATAWWQMPPGVTGEGYYEYLFWGGGHTLQFAYTQLAMLAWLLLAWHSGMRLPGDARWYAGLLLLGVAPVLLTPLIYLLYDTLTAESRFAFTHLMRYGGGLGAIPVGLLVTWGLLRSPGCTAALQPLRRALWMSLLLFFAGGLIAMFISGVNTIITAHYHGAIVGVTLALMGLAYLLLPRLGYPPAQGRLAAWQPWIYGSGQLLNILGLAASGVMGVQRKTAGAAQGLDTLSAKLAMGVMGVGGLLAVVGGILFVWVMLRAFLTRQIPASEP